MYEIVKYLWLYLLIFVTSNGATAYEVCHEGLKPAGIGVELPSDWGQATISCSEDSVTLFWNVMPTDLFRYYQVQYQCYNATYDPANDIVVKSYYTTELESDSKTIDMLGDEKYCKMIVCAELNRRGITYAWLTSEMCELKNVTLDDTVTPSPTELSLTFSKHFTTYYTSMYSNNDYQPPSTPSLTHSTQSLSLSSSHVSTSTSTNTNVAVPYIWQQDPFYTTVTLVAAFIATIIIVAVVIIIVICRVYRKRLAIIERTIEHKEFYSSIILIPMPRVISSESIKTELCDPENGTRIQVIKFQEKKDDGTKSQERSISSSESAYSDTALCKSGARTEDIVLPLTHPRISSSPHTSYTTLSSEANTIIDKNERPVSETYSSSSTEYIDWNEKTQARQCTNTNNSNNNNNNFDYIDAENCH